MKSCKAVLERSREASILGSSVRFKSALGFSIKLYKQEKGFCDPISQVLLTILIICRKFLLTLFLSVVIKQRGHRERDARFLESYFAFKVLLVLLLNCTNRLFDLVFSFKLYKQAIFVTIRSWVLVNILVIFYLLLTNLSVSRLLNNAGIEKKTRGFLEKEQISYNKFFHKDSSKNVSE